MPLDHYVSQTHLKQFYAPGQQQMVAIKKATLASYLCDSYSQCRLKDGSTNEFLSEPRAVEEFLKNIEPRYNGVIARLGQEPLDNADVFVLAGFITMVQLCSPAGRRIAAVPFATVGDVSARLMDARGAFGSPPEGMGADSLTELLDSGRVSINVNDRYPQAIGISSFHELINSLGNFEWEILLNEHSDSPFFTSDFPIAFESTRDPRIINKVVPLSPTVAVRIHPKFRSDKTPVDFSFPHHRWWTSRLVRNEVRQINQLIVRAAETTVYCRQSHQWTRAFVERNRNYRVDSNIQKVPSGTGVLILHSQRIQAYQHPPLTHR